MRIIPAQASVICTSTSNSPKELAKKIEFIGRHCYKSEDKITDDSCLGFVSRMIKSRHEAMVEHASLIFEIPTRNLADFLAYEQFLSTSTNYKSYLRITKSAERAVISGNIRAWRSHLAAFVSHYKTVPSYFYEAIQYNALFFPEYVELSPRVDAGFSFLPISVTDLRTEEEFLFHYDISAMFVCDRGVSHELVRHRDGSFAQESTRYCNYANDKFGNELTFVDLSEGILLDKKMSALSDDIKEEVYAEWLLAMEDAQRHYLRMIELGATPQIARSVLPNSVKTEICLTFNIREWQHFFNLRAIGTTGSPHPQMVEVTKPLLADFANAYPEFFKREV